LVETLTYCKKFFWNVFWTRGQKV